MPIKSYLVFPLEGKKGDVQSKLSELGSCEVFPAENNELLVLVTDTTSQQEDESVTTAISQIQEIKHFSLVAGFNDDGGKITHDN